MLPIVSGSEVSTPVGGTKIDSGAFREAALAPGRLAQAVGQDVGGVFDEVSQKIQANRNASMVFKADLGMRKSKDEFTAQLAKMPDPGTWLPAWKQQVDQQRDAVLNNPHAGPDVKRVLNQKFDVWEAATTSEIRTQALRKGVADSREDAIADSTYAAHQGDIEGAKNILNAAVSHYALSSSDANRIGKRFPTIAAQAQADTAISTNPIKAPELIKQFEGVMEPRMFVAVQARAREAQNQARSANLNDLAEQMDNSPDGTLDPKTISAAVKDGQITQRGADGLIARMDRAGKTALREDQKHQADLEKSYQKTLKQDAKTKTESLKDDLAVSMMAAQDHDWVDDPKPAETARQMKDEAAHLPPALRIRAYNHIDKLRSDAEKKGEKEEKPVQSDIFNRGKQDFARGLFRPAVESDITEGVEASHWWQSDTRKVVGKEMRQKTPDTQWDIGATPGERAQASVNYAKWQDSMRGFFKQNPDATSEQAEQFSQQIMAPHVEAQVKASIVGQSTTVRVKSKDGKVGTIPAANLQKAIDAGYSEVK